MLCYIDRGAGLEGNEMDWYCRSCSLFPSSLWDRHFFAKKNRNSLRIGMFLHLLVSLDSVNGSWDRNDVKSHFPFLFVNVGECERNSIDFILLKSLWLPLLFHL